LSIKRDSVKETLVDRGCMTNKETHLLTYFAKLQVVEVVTLRIPMVALHKYLPAVYTLGAAQNLHTQSIYFTLRDILE
jgi:hypothetical protein